MRKHLLPLSFLAMSLPALSLEVPTAPHIIVNGMAEYKSEPDMATLSVSVSALQKEGLKAKQQVDSKVAAFFSKLEAMGIERSDVEAGNLVVSPEYQYEANKRPQLIGHRAQRQLAIKLYQMDKLSELIDTALAAGLESVSQVVYGLKNAQDAKDKVRLEAVNDAKHKAEMLAQSFGMKLGKVYSVEYRSAMPMPVYARSLKMMAPAAQNESADTGYQQQSITFTDSVDAAFTLE
ncbi:SIMPL domain-containing protein [Aeromonas simiae]|uniref:SIMPL domain-containing protein n=1 Tax=Aeromonas simiae TaxID=218936 RepID=UPI00266CAA82|nr:SIMPL domain-containing protein [Aeromonas simiae]MDO2950027.1 SIMPL domain-containing protein [Aeromonas simiae]MDO2953973.1 SIMPL domain-containing protein [Aeromonas simiae]MDO2957396.1 SIMPL domain-containing protein [Aeromonas simiae]